MLLPAAVVVLGACLAVSWTAAFVWVLKQRGVRPGQQQQRDNELEDESESVITVAGV